MGPPFYNDRMQIGVLYVLYIAIIHLSSITIMDRRMLAAIVAATLLPLFVNAREGPECPADPYVSDFRNRYKQQLTFRHLLKPIGELL